jgi:hypothetical protein
MRHDYHRNEWCCRVIYDGAAHAASWSYWIVPGTLEDTQ